MSRSVSGAVLNARRVLIRPLLVLLAGMSAISAVRADDNVTAQAAGYTDKGYGRLVLTFSEEIRTRVRVENNIVVIDFAKPVNVAAGNLASRLAGYVQIVRRDPDGTALRLALGRKAKVNVMEAAEKLFVDFLPEGWVGLPPSLPTEVVDELARRARVAEQKAKMEMAGPAKVWPPVKMRYAMAPTFSRFSFEMAEPMKVLHEREGQELRVTFGAPVKVDFGEALARLPATVVGLTSDYQPGATTVKLVVAPKSELRTFQENGAFVVDVLPAAQQAPSGISGEAKPAENSTIAAEDPRRVVSDAAPEAVPGTAPAVKQELAAVSFTAEPEAGAPAPRAGKTAPSLPAAAEKNAEEKPVQNDGAVPAAKSGPVFATVERQDSGLAITLPFNEPVAGAMFRRGNTAFIVLDSARSLGLGELENDPSRIVKGVAQSRISGGQLIKMQVAANQLMSLAIDDAGWTIRVGGMVANPSRPIPARRVFVRQDRAGVFIPLGSPGRAYRIKDDEIGDSLIAITAVSPVRGLVRGQDFVDFEALATVQGVALAPKADDLTVELSMEGVTISRPEGLSVSEMGNVLQPLPEKTRGAENMVTALDPDIWEEERKSDYADREAELSRSLAEAPVAARAGKRLTLARFYLAHGLASNAAGVLNAADEHEEKSSDGASYAMLRGFAELAMQRPQDALRDLNKLVLAKSPQAALLRASALSKLMRWPEARDQFNAGKNAVASLPIGVQREVLLDAMRAMIGASDFAAAGDIGSQLDVVGVPADMMPAVKLLSARLMEGVGRNDQAAKGYAELAAGPEGPAMAEARLRLVQMRVRTGDFDRAKSVESLETLAFVWRGDETEVETMSLLAKLYAGESRYRDAFNLLDAALLVRPDAGVTRGFYNEMAATFEDLFLSDRAKSIDPIEALSIYYDFSKLTPIGRRGDELIRRLADRLVAVDLLDQAGELLDYQVKYRLTGVAKAQVAAKLAWVYLLNNKPAPAIRALANTRLPDLPRELREQRLVLEARALSELGRYDTAIELTAGIPGAESERLRGDIYWAAKRWREAGESYERLLGARWQVARPLNEMERGEVLRAAMAFTLGSETIGLARLRDRYAAKMPESSERTALGIMAAAGGNDPKKIGDIAKTMSTVDNLRQFLRLYQARYPDKPLPETADAKPQKVSAR